MAKSTVVTRIVTELVDQFSLTNNLITDDEIPIKRPFLSDRGGDLNKRWYVTAYFWKESEERLVRQQITIPSVFKTDLQRRNKAKLIIKAINELLDEGFHLKEQIEAKEFQTYKLGAAVMYFLNLKSGLRESSKKDYRLRMNKLVDHFGFDMDYRKVTKSMAHDYLDEVILRGAKARTRNNFMSISRTFFQFLKERGKIAENPFSGIKPLRSPKIQYHPFSDKQAKKALEYLETRDYQLMVFCKIMYFTFIRRNELRLIQIRDVDLVNRKIRIHRGIAKSHQSRSVRIVPPLMKYIEEMELHKYPKEFYLFGKFKEPGAIPFQANTLTDNHTKYMREINIPAGITLYSWKHTGVRAAIMKHGVNPVTVQQTCGHKSLNQTAEYLRELDVYVHTDLDKMEDI